MAQELSAGPVTLLQLLRNEREYVSPLFQRRYVWTVKQIEQLWKDVDEILEGRESARFLGALVLEVKSSGVAFQPDSSWIVDGQQRMTTLYMSLLEIARCAELNSDHELAASLYRQYLFNQDGQHQNKPKVTPTLPDYRQFNGLFSGLTGVSPRLKPAYGDETGSLHTASRKISSEVKRRIFEDKNYSPSKARDVSGVLLQKLKFVQINLGDSEDPHQVFDSLNAQGVRLENKDLIRNIVFQRLADDPGSAEALYNGQWLPFEQELGANLDDYFFPFALIAKPTATKSTLLSTLRDRWASLEPHEIMSDLRTFVPAFLAITDSDESRLDRYESDALKVAIKRLNLMNAPSSIYPFVMQVLINYENGTLSELDALGSLRIVESFLVRRAIAGFEPTGLHALYKDLWSQTFGVPVNVIGVIDRSATIQYPKDEQFINDIKQKPLYGRRMAKYILAEYERGLLGGDPFPDIDLTIDHVMPQTLTPAWRGVVSQEDHDSLKDTWANLVPLSGAANSEKGQMTWSDARVYFQSETVFKTTKRLAQSNENWDTDAIKQRAESLAHWAVQRWPRIP